MSRLPQIFKLDGAEFVVHWGVLNYQKHHRDLSKLVGNIIYCNLGLRWDSFGYICDTVLAISFMTAHFVAQQIFRFLREAPEIEFNEFSQEVIRMPLFFLDQMQKAFASKV